MEALALDGSAAWINRSVTGKHSLERSLFESTTVADETSSTSGFRIEFGASWLATLASGPGGHPWVAGLRLAPYLAKVDHGNPDPGRTILDSRELGIAASLSLSLQGRRGTEGGLR